MEIGRSWSRSSRTFLKLFERFNRPDDGRFRSYVWELIIGIEPLE